MIKKRYLDKMTEEKCYKFCIPDNSFNPDEIDGCYNFCFPTAIRLVDDGFNYCNEPPTNQDCGCFGPRGRDCIMCYTCLSPVGMLIDIITIPFRFSYCSYLSTKKCCKKCCQKCNKDESN